MWDCIRSMSKRIDLGSVFKSPRKRTPYQQRRFSSWYFHQLPQRKIGRSATEHLGQWPYLNFLPKVCLTPANLSGKGRGIEEEEAALPLEKPCTGTLDTRGSSFCSNQRSRSRSKAASTGSSTMGSSWKKSSSSTASVNAWSWTANPGADIASDQFMSTAKSGAQGTVSSCKKDKTRLHATCIQNEINTHHLLR